MQLSVAHVLAELIRRWNCEVQFKSPSITFKGQKLSLDELITMFDSKSAFVICENEEVDEYKKHKGKAWSCTKCAKAYFIKRYFVEHSKNHKPYLHTYLKDLDSFGKIEDRYNVPWGCPILHKYDRGQKTIHGQNVTLPLISLEESVSTQPFHNLTNEVSVSDVDHSSSSVSSPNVDYSSPLVQDEGCRNEGVQSKESSQNVDGCNRKSKRLTNKPKNYNDDSHSDLDLSESEYEVDEADCSDSDEELESRIKCIESVSKINYGKKCKPPLTDDEDEDSPDKRELRKCRVKIRRQKIQDNLSGPCKEIKWKPDQQDEEDLKRLVLAPAGMNCGKSNVLSAEIRPEVRKKISQGEK